MRTFAVGTVFFHISIMLLRQEGQPLALVGALIAIVVSRVLLGWLLEHLERSIRGLRWLVICMLGGAISSPLWMHRVDDDGPWLPFAIFLVMFYLAAYFWIMSDRRVVSE